MNTVQPNSTPLQITLKSIENQNPTTMLSQTQPINNTLKHHIITPWTTCMQGKREKNTGGKRKPQGEKWSADCRREEMGDLASYSNDVIKPRGGWVGIKLKPRKSTTQRPQHSPKIILIQLIRHLIYLAFSRTIITTILLIFNGLA